jgi:hypothetical protein
LYKFSFTALISAIVVVAEKETKHFSGDITVRLTVNIGVVTR